MAVLDALGDALARYDRADIVAGDERGELVGIDVRVDGHQTAAGSNPWGRLNTIFSSVMTATSSTIARWAATGSITSRTSASGAPAPAVMPCAPITPRPVGTISLHRATHSDGVPDRSAVSQRAETSDRAGSQKSTT